MQSRCIETRTFSFFAIKLSIMIILNCFVGLENKLSAILWKLTSWQYENLQGFLFETLWNRCNLLFGIFVERKYMHKIFHQQESAIIKGVNSCTTNLFSPSDMFYVHGLLTGSQHRDFKVCGQVVQVYCVARSHFTNYIFGF